MRIIQRAVLAGSAVAFAIVSLACGTNGASTARSGSGKSEEIAEPVRKAPAKASPELQAKRLKLIEDFQARGVLGKVKVENRICKAQIGFGFKSLKIDDKKVVANLLFSWAYDLPLEGRDLIGSEHVRFTDDRTGKTYATFSGTGFSFE